MTNKHSSQPVPSVTHTKPPKTRLKIAGVLVLGVALTGILIALKPKPSKGGFPVKLPSVTTIALEPKCASSLEGVWDGNSRKNS
jgi:hypothetical protein